MNNREEDNYYLSISKEELRQLPQAHFNGTIEVIDRVEDLDAAVKKLRCHSLIGFDTETKPSFKKGHSNLVSLLQLSCGDKCFLFRLNKVGFTDSLKALLEDKNIFKVGASVHDDFINLNKLSEFHPDGFVDIQNYVKRFRIEDNSLARIYGVIFEERISKNQRLSNWEQDTLSQSQKEYAALDAFACARIYQYLESGQFSITDCRFRCYPPSDSEK